MKARIPAILLALACLGALLVWFLRASPLSAPQSALTGMTPSATVSTTAIASIATSERAKPTNLSNGSQTSQQTVLSRLNSGEKWCQDPTLGLGSISSEREFEQKIKHFSEGEFNALAKLLSVLSKSAQPTERAAALFLHAQLQVLQSGTKLDRQNPECLPNAKLEGQSEAVKNILANCERQFKLAFSAASFQDNNDLAQLAIYSRDPQIYALSFQACNSWHNQAQGYCQPISALQWAQRDPNNGVVWLYAALASEVEGAKAQNSELDQALFRLSISTEFDYRLSALAQLRANLLVQQQSTSLQFALFKLSTQSFEQFLLPDYGPIYRQYCKADQLVDSNRRQICEGIANKLVTTDSTLIGYSIGFKLGERLGWSAGRLSQLKQDRDAWISLVEGLDASQTKLDAKSAQAAQASQSSGICQRQMKQAAWLENSSFIGEIATAKKLFSEQKRSKAELAALYEENRREQLAREAQASKSGK